METTLTLSSLALERSLNNKHISVHIDRPPIIEKTVFANKMVKQCKKKGPDIAKTFSKSMLAQQPDSFKLLPAPQ